MKLRPTDKTALRFLDLSEWLLFLLGGLFILISITDALAFSKRLKTETHQSLVEGYNGFRTGLTNPIPFEQYKSMKNDSVEAATRIAIERSGGNRRAYDQFYSWNILITISFFLFAAVGIRVLFQALRSPFELKERLHSIDEKLIMLLVRTAELQMSKDEFEAPETEDLV